MKKNKSDKKSKIEEKLDRIIDLLERIITIQLFREGQTQVAIAKHLGVATDKVNKILKGIKKKK